MHYFTAVGVDCCRQVVKDAGWLDPKPRYMREAREQAIAEQALWVCCTVLALQCSRTRVSHVSCIRL